MEDKNAARASLPEGMHLTPIGGGNVLLEPGEALDPTDPDAYLVALLGYLQQQRAKRLIYDLKNVAVIEAMYYGWLKRLHALCAVSGIELVAVNMRPAAAYALALVLDETPPFTCALNVDRAR